MMETKKLPLYNELARRDIINMAKGLLDNKSLFQRDSDGKLDFEVRIAWDTPWHYVKPGWEVNCNLWNNFMFNNIFKRVPHSLRQGRTFVPAGCQNCYKVVVRPETLRQLFAMVELLKRLDVPSKCGIERREYVHGLYGAYFYNRGLPNGLEKYKMVRKAVDEDPLLGPDIGVLLKRACTEMEQQAGPSNLWTVSPEQGLIEKLVYETINVDNVRHYQTPMGVDYVHGRWIEFAYAWGDDTVFDYLDESMPMYPPYVTYHHLAEQQEDEPVDAIIPEPELIMDNIEKCNPFTKEDEQEYFSLDLHDGADVKESVDRIQNLDLEDYGLKDEKLGILPCTCDVAGDCTCKSGLAINKEIKIVRNNKKMSEGA